MADYFATTRSNYFRVKDAQKFTKEMQELGLHVTSERENEDKAAAERFMVCNEEGDGWPSFVWSEEEEEHVEVDFCDVLSSHLAEGEVAILMEVGFEKLRYFVGEAVAINAAGEQRVVGLRQIYELAKELAPEGAEISPCEY